jgi:2-desacetyl-2-hydroxyethyl bacteriochlorophyllide A dehydrogenase
MKTIVLETPGQFRQTETEAPNAFGTEEALVRVRRIGICGTDYHAFRGRQPFFTYPRILGHELGAEILALGSSASGLKVGDRCAVEPYLYCGVCIACRRGKTNCCVRLKVLGVHTDGGMREIIRVPIANLHRSEVLSLEQLALVETLGIGAHAVQRAQIEPGEFALVIGAGPIGLGVMQFARAEGAQVIALDTNAARLQFCRENLGVAHIVEVNEDALDTIRAQTSGDLPTVVFDATGNPDSMHQAFAYVASGGRLIFVGLFQGDVTFHDPEFHRRELTLLATRNSTGADFARIIAQMEAGKLDTRPWITHRATFSSLPECFPDWLLPETGVIKAVVEL